MAVATELKLDVGWGSLKALAWRKPGKPRAICMHGWMDNAASFQPLAAYLGDLDLVALEFAGHGHSDHRPHGANYYFTEYLFDLDAALNALEWESCGIIGHSLGAGIGSAFACAARERADWLVMLDGLGALAEPPDAVPERISRSLKSVSNPRRHERVYASVEDAARTRQKNNPMLASSARLLAERALEPSEAGYQWRTDGRLLWTSPLLATEEQARQLLSGIRCPALALTTEVLAGYLGENLGPRLAAVPGLVHEEVEGGHHVHMDAPDRIVEPVQSFLQSIGSKP